MKIIKLNENSINHSDLWIIGGTSLMGLSAGLLVLESLNTAMIGFLVIGIGLGLVVSTLRTKYRNKKY